MDDASSGWLSKVKRTEMRSQRGWGVDSQPGHWRQQWHWVVGPGGTEKMLTSSTENTAALTIQLQPWLFQLTFSRLSKIWEIWGTVLLSKAALKERKVVRKTAKKGGKKEKGKEPLPFYMAIKFLFKTKSRKMFCQAAMSFLVDSIHRKCRIYALAVQSPFIIKTLPLPLPRTICHIFINNQDMQIA